MLVELFNGHMNAALAAEEIYGYIERHDEWASEDRAKLEEKAVELEEEISATKLELECIQGMYEDTF